MNGILYSTDLYLKCCFCYFSRDTEILIPYCPCWLTATFFWHITATNCWSVEQHETISSTVHYTSNIHASKHWQSHLCPLDINKMEIHFIVLIVFKTSTQYLYHHLLSSALLSHRTFSAMRFCYRVHMTQCTFSLLDFIKSPTCELSTSLSPDFSCNYKVSNRSVCIHQNKGALLHYTWSTH